MQKFANIFGGGGHLEAVHSKGLVLSCHPELVSGSDPSAQGARCRNKSGMTCWKAFTLAEVLITLGIIGIVASLTMPGLINDYQKKFTKRPTWSLKTV